MGDPGQIETELGVPIPGVILPPERWTRTALKKLPQEGPIDWEALFGRRAPIVLDLGCGNGRFTLASALGRPEIDHLGLDILPLVIRYATRRANQRGLANVRFAVGGAAEFLATLVAPRSIAEIHVYHPQPYGDAQKIGRRLLTPEFFASVHRARAGRAVRDSDRQPGLLALHRRRGPADVRVPPATRPLARHARGTLAPRDHGPKQGAGGFSRLGPAAGGPGRCRAPNPNGRASGPRVRRDDQNAASSAVPVPAGKEGESLRKKKGKGGKGKERKTGPRISGFPRIGTESRSSPYP